MRVLEEVVDIEESRCNIQGVFEGTGPALRQDYVSGSLLIPLMAIDVVADISNVMSVVAA